MGKLRAAPAFENGKGNAVPAADGDVEIDADGTEAAGLKVDQLRPDGRRLGPETDRVTDGAMDADGPGKADGGGVAGDSDRRGLNLLGGDVRRPSPSWYPKPKKGTAAPAAAAPRSGLLLAPRGPPGAEAWDALGGLPGLLLLVLLLGWLVLHSLSMLPSGKADPSRKLLADNRPWDSFSYGNGASLMAMDVLRDFRPGLLLLATLLANDGLLSAMLPNEAGLLSAMLPKDALLTPNDGLLSAKDGRPSKESSVSAVTLAAGIDTRALLPGLLKPLTEDLLGALVSKTSVLLDVLPGGVLPLLLKPFTEDAGPCKRSRSCSSV